MKWLALIWLLGLNLPLFGQEKLPDPKEVLSELDTLYRSQTSRAEMSMSIETPDWTREMTMQVWSKGMDHTLIRVLTPRRDRGISTLKQDDQVWNFFPKIDRVMRVPPSMMMGSWMGSDLTNDDLVRDSSYAEDYKSSIKRDGEELILELVPKETTVSVWARIEMRMQDEKPWLPIEQKFFNDRGEATRSIRFSEVKSIGGRTIPTKMEVIPLTKKGHKTSIEYKSIEFDIELDEQIFTLRHLQQTI
jgi:outer membrane lipoprotein-sorting protein